ncbi:MAG: ABC transporter permease [Candidatus Competibacteraceae bacterium]
MSRALGDSLLRLRALLGKEFLQVWRNPRMRFFLVVPPLVQLLIFGYAAVFDVRQAVIGVVDEAGTQATRELLAAVTAGGHFTVQHYRALGEADAALDRNEIRAIVQFFWDFEQAPVVQLIADGADPNSAQMIVGELSQALNRRARTDSPQPPLRIEERAWYNPNLDDRPFFLPGLIANVVFTSTLMLIALSVVREREIGTLERLLVTPVARLEVLLAKMATVATVGLIDVILVTLVAVGWFEVPLRGSLIALALGSLLFLLSTLGLGLVISSYSNTQQQAMLLAFMVIMPLTMLSGFAFPISNMPVSIQWLTWLDPLRFFLTVIRVIFLKGEGVSAFGLEYGMMALLGGIMLLLSWWRLR